MSHVTNAASMLYNCKELKHLYVSPSMTSLVNYQTVCTGIGKTTAPCIIHAPEGFDFGEGVDTSALYFKWNSGNFYLEGTHVAYSMLTDDVLTFYDDDQAWERGGTPWAMNTTSNPAWTTSNTLITKVVFDASFAQANPVSTYRWFLGMTGLTKIEGLNYLNTTNVTNMNQMFYNCSELASLNLSKFDLTTVASFTNMLYGCSGLKELHIHESMSALAASACSTIGTADSPCMIYAPENFDFGVDISGDFFRWKQGYFCLGHKLVLLGDVNDDGQVNISDVVTLVNYILGQDPSPFVFEAADVNEDTQINIGDVVALVNIILMNTKFIT
jgi:surface protein